VESNTVERMAGNCKFTLFVSGDFCPARLTVDELLKPDFAETVFGEFNEIIMGADLSITNLECPLTLGNSSISKIGPNLKAHPVAAAVLKSAGFDMVTLANNHIYDYGQLGLSDTLENLNHYGVFHVGAGLDLQEAKKIFYKEFKSIKLAIVNFAEVEFSCADSQHGGANPMDLIDNIHQIQEARNNADHVLVIIHGGHENFHYPSPGTKKRYRFYAESGASAVIAHHTHCIGGYEYHKSVPIFYSLGNFFFPELKNKMPQSWHEGYALVLKIGKSFLEFEILAYEQCKGGKFCIKRKRDKEIFAEIERINVVLNDDEMLTAFWKEYIENSTQYYLSTISDFSRYKTAFLKRSGLLRFFYKRSQLIAIQQMIRCEAHREVLRTILEVEATRQQSKTRPRVK